MTTSVYNNDTCSIEKVENEGSFAIYITIK